MLKAYLEPSAIDALVRAGAPGQAVLTAMSTLGWSPVIGQFTIHEIGRGTVRGHEDACQTKSQFILDLEPEFHHPAEGLMPQEVANYRRGVPVIPMLDSSNLALTEKELRILAAGSISDELRGFIVTRDEAKATKLVRDTEDYLSFVRQNRKEYPDVHKSLKTFEEVVNLFGTDLPRFLAGQSTVAISLEEAEDIARTLDTYPAMKTELYAAFYNIFICIRHNVVPASDVLDDLRHLLEASYCNVFVSNDRSQIRRAGVVAPHLDARNVSEIVERLD